jgi:hypothetical protein
MKRPDSFRTHRHLPGCRFWLTLFLFFLPGILFSGCEKEYQAVAEVHTRKPALTDQVSAIGSLPRYYRFLKDLKQEGFAFCDMKTFLSSDTSRLPRKLIVIRHDVHARDIPWSYMADDVETQVIGEGHSTYYVMWGDPVEEAENNSGEERQYLKLIKHLETERVDIQPHLSPIDMYIAARHPYWAKLAADSLKDLFDRNYRWVIGKDGRQLITTDRDVFHIQDVNKTILSLLAGYNAQWTKVTGLKVEGYASHGSGTSMNRVLNNAWLLDQRSLLHSGVYGYDTYNTSISEKLAYLSDNTLPAWMNNPSLIRPGRYQLLMHPYQWQRAIPLGKTWVRKSANSGLPGEFM